MEEEEELLLEEDAVFLEIAFLGSVVPLFLERARVLAFASEMRDREARVEADSRAFLPGALTEIHILIVEEKFLIETLDLLEECSGDEESASAYPGNFSRGGILKRQVIPDDPEERNFLPSAEARLLSRGVEETDAEDRRFG